MGDWWASDLLQDPVRLVSWVVLIIGSICLHELAHGWVAIRCGDDVPLHTGHMTLNPFVHIPWPWAWIMFALFGFTWGLMPTNPQNYRGRFDDAKVSFAGPAMNVLLAVVATIVAALFLKFGRGVQDPLRGNLVEFFALAVYLNVFLAMFNLIPVPPLDGSHILGNFVPAYRRLWQREHAGVVSLVLAIVLFRVGSPFLQGISMDISAAMLHGVTRVLGGATP